MRLLFCLGIATIGSTTGASAQDTPGDSDGGAAGTAILRDGAAATGRDEGANGESAAGVERDMSGPRKMLDGRRKEREMRRAMRGEAREGKGEEFRDALGMKRQLLEFSDKYFGAVQDPYRALGFAVLGVKEHYRRMGKPEQAVAEIEAIIARTKDQKARNVLLFVLRQIHESSRDSAKVMEINKRIIDENLPQH